ncbi:Retrovirus-related Pol polyprotein from transposon RE1 [Vitis vinifera]|uniref:Retrovirus-related Pol polyprotein from transposon RE1 n=1 Tax=Vitis vinifera TaxID=29760 RepID=A0A438GPU9_VITVI|nr:Retrovirus-related Pol polyprotein from transposon RE1 [Vitis vinifera]
MIETQYNANVRVLRSDNGGEYQSFDLQKYLEGHGIIHQTTCSNTLQQNAVAKRKNRHLLEVVRASLIAAKILISYWREAITSTVYLINRVPSSSINFQTPLQALIYVIVALTVPNLPPRVFGCVAFVHLHKHQRTKLTSRALQCVLVGYALHKKGYHEDSINDHPETEEVIEEGKDSTIEPSPPSEQFGSEDVFTEIPNQSSSVEGVLNLEPDPFMKRLPHCHNRECPPGKKPVGYRWIYTVKYKTDGSIEQFKARLVVKGYTQTYGIDYTETFTPVAKINTVRVLLSLAANLGWPLQQFDVKNVFMHGELSEEVYMDLPSGCMVSEKQCQKVCKLKKSLYELKQSLRAWFGRFTKSMTAFGYRQSNSNHTLFLKKQHGEIMTLIVYVDDMVVTGNDPEERKALQNYLSREFEMKDLDLLQETGMSGCQPVDTPIEGLKLCVEPNQVSTDKGRYQRLVWRLMYLAHTRLDLAYALSVAGAMDDRRSTSGYFTFVGGNLVTWKSKKRNVVTRLSAEAKFRGMALGLFACDIAHNLVQHDRTKHVEVDRFSIKEKLDDKIVELPKIRSED